jgi:quinol monooxygenase YgiN
MLHEVYASSEAFDAHLTGASIQQMRRDSAGLQVSLNGLRYDFTE